MAAMRLCGKPADFREVTEKLRRGCLQIGGGAAKIMGRAFGKA